MTSERFDFDFDLRYRLAATAFGVTPGRAYVQLSDDRFIARFGPWTVDTPRDNVRGAGVSGPYSVVKTIGGAHLSFADRGLTFATNDRAGACITFRLPVPGIDPLGVLKHPGLTVTVADPEALVAALTETRAVRTDLESQETEQHAIDDLHTMTARELRALADDLGVRHTSSMSKRELVDLVEARVGGDLVDVLEDRT